MNFVEPIRDITTVQDIADYLKEKNEKYYIMYLVHKGVRKCKRVRKNIFLSPPRYNVGAFYDKLRVEVRKTRAGENVGGGFTGF